MELDKPKIVHYKCTPESWHRVTKPLEEYLVKEGCVIRQMKEKFGGLRVYYDFPNYETNMKALDRAAGAVSLAEMIIEGKYSD